jgi:hypothetical protein
MRVICQKAFGSHPLLTYDTESTKLLRAQAKSVKAKAPRYTTPVDLGGTGGVWAYIVSQREKMASLPNTSTLKARTIRDCTIFLERHDAVSRSDCESKCSMHDSQLFRVYAESGEPLDSPLLSDRLDACLAGDGGSIQRNYLNPKDPRRKGELSDTVETRPLRIHMLMNEDVPHLSTPERVGYLCSVRSRRDYVRCLEALKVVHKVPLATQWVHLTNKSIHVGMNDKLQPLTPSSIAEIIKKVAKGGGLNVGKNEAPGALDLPERTKYPETLAGHFLRGHAGSVAYTLAVVADATWSSSLGIDRARHTMKSFFRNYSRGVVPRLITTFRQHPHSRQLRFEEAARL